MDLDAEVVRSYRDSLPKIDRFWVVSTFGRTTGLHSLYLLSHVMILARQEYGFQWQEEIPPRCSVPGKKYYEAEAHVDLRKVESVKISERGANRIALYIQITRSGTISLSAREMFLEFRDREDFETFRALIAEVSPSRIETKTQEY